MTIIDIYFREKISKFTQEQRRNHESLADPMVVTGNTMNVVAAKPSGQGPVPTQQMGLGDMDIPIPTVLDHGSS